MKFPLERFKKFCARLLIDTKEKGQMYLAWDNMLSTQRYFITEIAKAIDEGIHFFVILKGRQEGITTICAALDLFWHYEHAGMMGTFAAQDEPTKDAFRAMLTAYHDGLPTSFKVKRLQNNRYFMNFKNRSKLAMQIGGGTKSAGGKGRGQAFAYIHATECSSWEDEESLASILASLADTNPLRLQIFESTARGMNLFKNMWDDAREAVTQRAIFIGWWLNELYRKERDTNEFRVYGEDSPSIEEQEWITAVKQAYDFDIEPEQLAWWRWCLAEKIHDENFMMQEFPPTADHAFILSGKNFFSLPKLHEIALQIAREPDPQFWRFKFRDNFLETELEKCSDTSAQLRVWEQPVDDGFYSIGADPAYGSAAWADRSVVEVYRCYADRFEQVAEFCMPEIRTSAYAWVVCCLAGYYKNSMLNLEVNGPGQAVQEEIDNLRRQAAIIPKGEARGLRDAVGNMRYFIYKKLDSMGGGGAYGYLTTQASKDRMFNAFRDVVESNHSALHSRVLVDEMKIIVRETDGFLGASGRSKDDCTVASSLAAVQYRQYIEVKLKQMGITWGKELLKRQMVEQKGHEPTPQERSVNETVGKFMARIGVEFGTQ